MIKSFRNNSSQCSLISYFITFRPLIAAAAVTMSSSLSSTSSSRKRSSDTPVVTTKPSRLRVRLRRFHAVAKWSWNANDDVCGICQSEFEGVAPGVKYPGDECPVVWGKCGHAFHLQCVSTWLNSNRNSCPICRSEWEFGSNQAE